MEKVEALQNTNTTTERQLYFTYDDERSVFLGRSVVNWTGNKSDLFDNGTTYYLYDTFYPSGYSLPSIIVASVFAIVLMVFVVIGNLLVIVAIATEKSLKNIQNWFIASLAVADFFLGVLIIPFSLANELMGYWIFGAVWCDIHSAADVLLCTASIMNLCLISLDRYWSITQAIEYLKKRTRMRAAFMIAFVWTLSAAICIPPLLGWKVERKPETFPKCEMTPRVQSKMTRRLKGTTSRELMWPICTTYRKHNFKRNRKHDKSTNNTSNKKYAAEQAAKELRLNPRVIVPQLSERSNTCQQVQAGQQTYGHQIVIQLKRFEADGRRKIHSSERSAVRQKSPVATTSAQAEHVDKCPPSMTNVTDTPTASTTRTDLTQNESIYFSAKSDGHSLRSPIRARLRHSRDQSSVKDNAENDNDAGGIFDTVTSPSAIYSPGAAQNVNSSEGSSSSSGDEESSKTLVDNADTSASSKDSVAVMGYDGSSRFDSSSSKMSPFLRRRPIRHEEASERPRGNTDSVDEPTSRDVRAPCVRHDDEVVVTSTAPSVSAAMVQRRRRAQIMREAMNHLKGFVEKFETAIEMADEDLVI